jgi:hypothetical protein
MGSDKFLPAIQIQIMINGYTKADPPTKKMVDTDVPEMLVDMGYGSSGSVHAQAVGDLSLITF